MFVATISGHIDDAEHDVEALEREFVQDVQALIDRWRHHVSGGTFTGASQTTDLAPVHPATDVLHAAMRAAVTVEDTEP